MTKIEHEAVELALELAAEHRVWRWKLAKARIRRRLPWLCLRGLMRACDAYALEIARLERLERGLS